MAPIFTYRTILTSLIFFTGFWAQAQNVGVNTTGSAPNAYALFDADNNGLLLGALLPRLSTASRIAMAGLSGTEDGLVVYDTTTKSFWYWDGTQWVEVGAGGGGGGWSLTGDAGTDDAVNFLGTTDAKPLVIRTDGTPRVRITNKGQIETLNTGESVFIGEGAGATSDILTPLKNVFIGYSSGNQNTTGFGNTAIGCRTLELNTTSWQNTAIGHRSMNSNISGSSNTAIGALSLNANTTGGENTAIGHQALPLNTTGIANVAIGSFCMNENNSGNFNTAAGRFAMERNTSGGANTAFGEQALNENSIGNFNTAIGRGALLHNTGSNNTGVGNGAMSACTVGEDNTGVGASSMANGTTGYSNTAVGANTLQQNTTAGENTAIGSSAMRSNLTANENTAVGAFALYSNTISEGNTALGFRALYTNDGIGPFSGTDNTALGYRAMESNTTGAVNTAIGSRCMSSNSTGSYNVAMGWLALDVNTSGSSNTAIGSIALTINTTGGDNTGVGRQTLYQNTTGSYNSALGSLSLNSNGTGSYNTALGYEALSLNTSGESNVGVGRNTNRWNYTGSNNTIVGSYAGDGGVPHSKSGCVFLGYRAGYFELVSNRLYIDNTDTPTPLIYGEFDNDFVTINQNLGIGIREFGGGSRILSIGTATPPAAPITDGGMLFAQDVGGTAELRVMDGAGNVTTISPHNFSLVPKSEPMAWAFYSENASLGQRVNVDMMRVVRLVEHMSGEPLVNLTDLSGGLVESSLILAPNLEGRISQLEVALEVALERIEELQRLVATQETIQTRP